MAEQKPNKLKTPPLKLLFRGILAALLIGIIANFYGIYSFYSKVSKHAFDDGRKIIIDVKTGEVKITPINNEGIKTVDITAKNEETKPEEKPAEQANGEEAKPAETKEDALNNSIATPEALNYKTANLAVIITDLGLKQSYLDTASSFSKAVTFAFSPYSRELQNKIRIAKNEGREVLLSLAFESENYPLTDSGQFTMHSFFEANQNIFRLQSTIATADGYSGVIAPLDEILTDKRDTMTPILENLKKKKLYFSYLRNSKNAALENDAKPMAVSVLPIDYAITEQMTADEVKATLSTIKEDLLKRKKRIVVAVQPYPTLTATMQEWLKNNVGANIQVAPASYFVIKN